MSLNSTPTANRLHIAFFGKRNAGKSSVVNAVTGQDLAVVSDVKGTTTDPVSKSMELLPLGPVVIIDTPGYDDEGELGELRVKKTKQILNKTDVAVLVVDSSVGADSHDNELINLFKTKNIPFAVVYNKSDLKKVSNLQKNEISVSALNNENIYALKELIGSLHKSDEANRRIIADKISPNDIVVLVTPIDESAPKGRLILPQQQTIRDILDANAVALVTKETELCETLKKIGDKVSLVITDSQVFKTVSEIVPENILLTSFSILMARYKGFLQEAVLGAAAIDSLKDGDTVLISEGCTHHRQCNDIGTVKLPNLLKKYTGKSLEIKTSSGTEFPEDLSQFSLVIHCGGCMVTEREMLYRMKTAVDSNVPMTNYGTAIAYMNGILKRSLQIFPELYNTI
ncbi:MAG: [Clostridia bacterium]|nr:[FeFe] hydrogenase H-cluster maturation GTPase HydF [Clostridia bacterium]